MTHRTLENLFARFSSEGDLDALAEVFDRVAPDLERLARKLTPDRNRAADLVQATFLTALERPATFEAGRSLRPWLLGILVHRASAERRLAARPIEPDRLTQREVETPVAALDASEFRTAVSNAIGELPENLRVVLEGRLLDDRDAGELAEELTISRGALRVRLHRGLERLRSILPPSLATAFALVFMHSRGLAQVRSHVLKEAARVSAGKGIAVSAGVAGVVMVSKNAMLIAGVMLVAVLAGVLYEGESRGRDVQVAEGEPTGLADARGEIAVAKSASPVRVDVAEPQVLTSSTDPASISVRVTHKDGSPAIGFETRLTYYEDKEARPTELWTDEAGQLVFEVPAGVRLSKVEALGTPKTIPATEGFRYPRIAKAGEEIEVELVVVEGWPLAGRVVDPDGRGVPNAEVLGWSRSRNSGEPHRIVRADSNGEFRLEHLGPAFVVTARAEGLACSKGLRGDLSDRVVASGLTIELVVAKRMHGVVLTPAGNPVQGAEMWVPNGLNTSSNRNRTHVAGITTFRAGRGKTVSDENGRFEIQGLSLDRHSINAKYAPYLVYREWRPTGEEPVEIVLDPGVSLSGRVLDADGQPAAGARVRFWPYWGNVQTTKSAFTCDDRGEFTLRGIIARENDQGTPHVLAVQHEGHALQVVESVKPGPKGGEFVEIHLQRELILAGRVLGEDGLPVSGVRVWIEGEREMNSGVSWGRRSTWEFCNDLSDTETDDDGLFRFEKLYDGDYTVHAVSPEDRNRSVDYEAQAGDESIELVLDTQVMRKVVFVGEVLDAISGEPVTSFTVIPMIDGSGYGNSFESAEGRFELAGFPVGRIELTVKSDGYADRQIPYRQYDVGEHQIQFRLAPERSVELSIVDKDGEPFANGRVEALDLAGQQLMFGVGQSRSSSSRVSDGRAFLQGLPGEQLTLRVFVGVRDDHGVHEFPIDLSHPIEGPFELVVERPSVATPTVPISLIVLVLDAKADEAKARKEIREFFNSRQGAWFSEAMKDGTLSFPECKVELVTEWEDRELSIASLTPAEGGGFLESMSQTTYFWGGTSQGVSSDEHLIPFPQTQMGRMPSTIVTLRVTSDCYVNLQMELDCTNAEERGIRDVVLLRRP